VLLSNRNEGVVVMKVVAEQEAVSDNSVAWATAATDAGAVTETCCKPPLLLRAKQGRGCTRHAAQDPVAVRRTNPESALIHAVRKRVATKSVRRPALNLAQLPVTVVILEVPLDFDQLVLAMEQLQASQLNSLPVAQSTEQAVKISG
jgi:hypothetical protein